MLMYACRRATKIASERPQHMLRPASRHPHLLSIFALCIALLGAVSPRIARTAASSQAVSATPTALSVSVPLGQRLTTSITLTNTTDAPVTPTVYEAWPATGAQTLDRQPSGPARVALPQQAARIDPQLLADFQRAADGRADFIVYLHDQADLSAAYTIGDWAARGEYVYRTLADWATSQQRDLRQQLGGRGLTYQPFWAVNAVLVHGSVADAQAIAERGDVALVRANRAAALPPEEITPAMPATCSPDQPSNTICWSLRKIGADRVWRQLGVDGRGVVVATIDTGVYYSHPALSSSYRGALGSGRYDHNYNWFEPGGAHATPNDDTGHGTHTMGTLVGAGNAAAGRPAVGVAPGARWITAKGCGTFLCEEADLIAAAQWMLAPTALDGTRPRPDLRPLIVSNSWAGAGGDPWYAGYTAAWRAAGIFPVFAAGNAGTFLQGCGSIAAPGDYADVVGVGATDRSDTITSFSLLGPTIDGRIKPDFSAPGGSIVSAWSSGADYRTLSGTSMATPHVAGVVALLWSANPALIGDYDATYAILRESARRLTDTRCGDSVFGPNNVYGHGRVDAFAAVTRARVDVPWLIAPGTIQPISARTASSFSVTLDAARVPGPGTYLSRLQVYDSLTKAPTTIPITMKVTPVAQQARISGRVVSVEDGAALAAAVGVRNGLEVATDSTGAYTLTLAPGTYELVASATSFLTEQRALNVTGDLRLPDFALQPDQPRIALATPAISTTLAFPERRTLAIPIDNRGTRPLHYRVTIPRDQFAIWRSDESGGPAYSWIDLPASAPKLALGNDTYTDEIPLKIDFPLFSYSFTETLVTSDGMLAFDEPFIYRGPLSSCLPDDNIYFYLIAAFRADLDPARGGQIRYGTLPNRKTFVLSYENIPLHTGPISATYTFQILLHEDGRIGFQYKQLAALPDKLSVGIQYAPALLQQIACGAKAPLYNGLAIELRPQTPTSLWLAGDIGEGVILPGDQQILSVGISWVRPTWPGLYQGRIVIDSSDPTNASIALPVRVVFTPAPNERWLPQIRVNR
jgi:subtilisin family serine protease